MFADFIEDKLAENSLHIKLLKMGIQDYENQWIPKDFRKELKFDNFDIINTFMKNVKQNFDHEEKLFIYKSVYLLCGYNESLTTLASFIPGLTINVIDSNEDHYIKEIHVTMEDEVFYDWELAEKEIIELCRELLLYSICSRKWLKITFEIYCKNKERNTVYVTKRNYRYYLINDNYSAEDFAYVLPISGTGTLRGETS